MERIFTNDKSIVIMKILLVVGSANDIFIVNMTKWLKASMPDSIIDIYEFYPSNAQETNTYFDNLGSANYNVWYNKIKGLRTITYPYYASASLKKFLKGKFYDVIHCHWITPPLVLTHGIHKHCNKLFATFWGTEWKNFKILYSQKLYKKHLDKFVSEIDYIVNSKTFKQIISDIYPQLVDKHIEGYLGSAPLEEVYKLMKHEDKVESKKKLNIDTSKTVVLIGYSGKQLHQHLPIIQELSKREELKNKLHLLAPMTRGAGKEYCDRVDIALKKSGYTYTLLRDCFLSNEDVARLRNATDITLQLSTTDGFSRSIVECVCAKSVLIYGNWLRYKEHLENSKLIAHAVPSIEAGIDLLKNIADCIEIYKEELEQNHINGKAKNLWSDCIKDWVNAYINH